MKIFLCASKYNFHRIQPVLEQLEKLGHQITLPNSYEDPFREEEVKKMGKEEHMRWKTDMLRLQGEKVAANDAVLIFNYEKNGQPNYIGGATFLEIFKAFELSKKIFFMNPIPENIFTDELEGMNPIIINENLTLIK